MRGKIVGSKGAVGDKRISIEKRKKERGVEEDTSGKINDPMRQQKEKRLIEKMSSPNAKIGHNFAIQQNAEHCLLDEDRIRRDTLGQAYLDASAVPKAGL